MCERYQGGETSEFEENQLGTGGSARSGDQTLRSGRAPRRRKDDPPGGRPHAGSFRGRQSAQLVDAHPGISCCVPEDVPLTGLLTRRASGVAGITPSARIQTTSVVAHDQTCSGIHPRQLVGRQQSAYWRLPRPARCPLGQRACGGALGCLARRRRSECLACRRCGFRPCDTRRLRLCQGTPCGTLRSG